MTRGVAIGVGLVVILLSVFTAGFFHGEDSSSAEPPLVANRPAPYPLLQKIGQKREMAQILEVEFDRDSDSAYAPKIVPGTFLSLTAGPSYRREAQMSLKVEDCAQSEEDLEAKLLGMKGEILEMVMEGTEGARTCALSVLIPSDHFREFVTYLREMGKVQSERITASRLNPGREPALGANGQDVRELSHVSLRMADEKVAQNVLESRGVLAASFDAGASHFMKGAAVMIEGGGYVLPFLVALIVMVVPFVIATRIRRLRTVRIQG